ncbi:hypothetical protein [Bacillus rubiinfantis]|uniref:hypothetical protein n=1 Tax=Bacillus rubiinfantis TaxID=1499680 RepID=UPI000693F077|nr:hypothetical protein [Bacillus rubiinfantis]
MIDGFSPYIYEVKENSVKISAITTNKFVQVPIELPEQPFPTEDSYRIEMEELSELLLTK